MPEQGILCAGKRAHDPGRLNLKFGSTSQKKNLRICDNYLDNFREQHPPLHGRPEELGVRWFAKRRKRQCLCVFSGGDRQSQRVGTLRLSEHPSDAYPWQRLPHKYSTHGTVDALA